MLARITVGLVAAALVALSGCGSSTSDQATQPEKVQQVKDQIGQIQRNVSHHHTEDPAPYPDRLISGGKIVAGGLGLVSSEVMEPETSGWTVSSGSQNTVVEAGGDAQHPSYGLFSILRTSYYVARQRIDDVRVPDSGPVTITKAPLGREIVDSAQKHGNIEFKSKSGISGTLHLADDTVTVDP